MSAGGRQTGIHGLAHHGRDAGRRLPGHPADADGVGVDDLPSAVVVRREVIEPHLRDVYDDAHLRRVRQYELRGDYHPASRARHPHIHSRIGAVDLVVADAEATSDVGQGVLLGGLGDLHFADDLIVEFGVDGESVCLLGRRLGWRCRRGGRRRGGRRGGGQDADERSAGEQRADEFGRRAGAASAGCHGVGL